MAVVFAWRNRADPQIRFALAAVVGPWVMFELVRTKLPHYMLPAFPPLAFLTADAVVRCLRGERDDLRRRGFLVGGCVVGLAMVGIGAGTVVLARRFGDPILPAVAVVWSGLRSRRSSSPACCAATPGGRCSGWARAWRRSSRRCSGSTCRGRTRCGCRSEPRKSCGGRRDGSGAAVMMDYKEPSLAFYQGGTIRENSAMRLSHELINAPATWWVITDEVWAKSTPDVRERLERGRTFGTVW